jgi:hypothetical protein
MKIRMKKHPQVEIEVLEMDTLFRMGAMFGSWCSVTRNDGTITFYSPSEWEPVPIEKWESASVTPWGSNVIRVISSRHDRLVDLTLPSKFRFVPIVINEVREGFRIEERVL